MKKRCFYIAMLPISATRFDTRKTCEGHVGLERSDRLCKIGLELDVPSSQLEQSFSSDAGVIPGADRSTGGYTSDLCPILRVALGNVLDI